MFVEVDFTVSSVIPLLEAGSMLWNDQLSCGNENNATWLMLINAVLVCPPNNTKFCACVTTPVEEFEKVGARAVNVNPASAIGTLPALLLRDKW
jgi:hypothetical protein